MGRELYAVAVYTGLRQAELRALECGDVDWSIATSP